MVLLIQQQLFFLPFIMSSLECLLLLQSCKESLTKTKNIIIFLFSLDLMYISYIIDLGLLLISFSSSLVLTIFFSLVFSLVISLVFLGTFDVSCWPWAWIHSKNLLNSKVLTGMAAPRSNTSEEGNTDSQFQWHMIYTLLESSMSSTNIPWIFHILFHVGADTTVGLVCFVAIMKTALK